MTSTVLLVEEDPGLAARLRLVLEYLEYDVRECPPEADWPALVGGGDRPDAAPPALHGLLLGPCSGPRVVLEAFRQIKAASPWLPIIVLAEAETIAGLHPDVVAGALDVVPLPARARGLGGALRKLANWRQGRHQDGSPRSNELFRNLNGSSRAIQRVREQIAKVAATDATVLILGESGTGKEVVARHLHYHSARRAKPFVPLNVGAIPADLIESELFGHEKGAFTGAITAHDGRFAMADGGTLFLDEIGDMPLPMQVKLLRVLQEKSYERVGSSRTQRANVRIIAATHVDLDRAMSEGRFREDLYYRINVFPIETPPLRERIEDLPLLVEDLVERLRHEGRQGIRLTAAAYESLARYRWPGNVRELANLVERLTISYPDGVVDVQDLPEKYQSAEVLAQPAEAGEARVPELIGAARLPRQGLDLREHLARLEYSLILQALEESDWVVANGARRLGMNRTTLVEKMRKYGLHRDTPSEA